MKRMHYVLLLLIFSTTLFAESNKKFTLEDIFRNDTFKQQTLASPQWSPDSRSFVFSKADDNAIKSIYKHDVQSGKERLWINGNFLINPDSNTVLKYTDFVFSPSGNKIIFKTDAVRVWRHFDEARFYLYDIQKQTIQAVYDGQERIRHVKLSPDETKIGYVRDNNIYVSDLQSGSITAVTDDGDGTIINGLSDWVYEEEFGKAGRWDWSETGKYIAWHQFDQTPIKTFSWAEYDKIDVTIRTVPYPKAGDPNSIVKIGVYDLEAKTTKWMDIGDETDIYIPRIRWTRADTVLLIERLNRLQNHLDFLAADPRTGFTKVKFMETDSAWLSITDAIYFLKDKHRFIRTSESGGYNHIYMYDITDGSKTAITGGDWEVTKVYGVDEAEGRIYFQANKERMEERQLFMVGLDGTDLKQISKDAGTHSAQFAPDFSAYLGKFSSVMTPTQARLHHNNGREIRTLVENKMDSLAAYTLVYPEFISFMTSDSVELRAMITRPNDFDPDKKYPVLIYGYSGPASQLVRNTWGRMNSKLWYNVLAQNGYIIFTLDQRGTGGRGKAFKNLAYGDIGHYMHFDHVEGVNYLRSLPYVDAERIGIWGWSGGGYLALMELCRGGDYYKMGIAVGSVVDYHLYDNIWTERYMGLPEQNVAGYQAANVLTYVDDYKEGLLIIHGSSDDNVHMQNSMQFIEKLQAAGKPFEMMIYPGKNHSMRGTGSVHYHLYSLMTRFILENL